MWLIFPIPPLLLNTEAIVSLRKWSNIESYGGNRGLPNHDKREQIANHVCNSWNIPWWRHQMETFSVSLALCAGNSPVPGEFPTQRPVTRSFDVYFDLRPNKRLSKQSWGWWFETLSWSLWRHCNAYDDDHHDPPASKIYLALPLEIPCWPTGASEFQEDFDCVFPHTLLQYIRNYLCYGLANWSPNLNHWWSVYKGIYDAKFDQGSSIFALNGIVFSMYYQTDISHICELSITISLKFWPIVYTIWADPNYIWGLAILADSLLFSVNNILAGLWLNCISSVEITLFLLANILLQHRALFQC